MPIEELPGQPGSLGIIVAIQIDTIQNVAVITKDVGSITFHGPQKILLTQIG